jgi:hypothetical protein
MQIAAAKAHVILDGMLQRRCARHSWNVVVRRDFDHQS